MINGSCHCGAVTFSLDVEPAWLTECNCSICRRIGGLWAYGTAAEIHVTRPDDGTIAYVWGDKSLAFHACKVCGCTTHWESLDRSPNARMAVNLRMANPADIAHIPVRCFDGAETWTYLDE
ncbi:MAG: GFA family protein [Acidobacteria bacterium]|nr:GFA family protein [Acidobacteriota bacterium]